MVEAEQDNLNYDRYNREERYICTHLFRLLHEPAREYRALRYFIGDVPDIGDFKIYMEVALIREAYHVRRADPYKFMDPLVHMVALQENVTTYFRTYSQLPEELWTPHLTHPRQILQKGTSLLTEEEKKIYGSIQGMFNAKPDLVICYGQELLVYEAKLTLGFDKEQIERTKHIAEIWAKLLYQDLGFEREPNIQVKKLGLEKFNPHVSWESIHKIAIEVYPETDRTRQALGHVLLLL